MYSHQLDDGDRTRPQIDMMFEENASDAIYRWKGQQGQVFFLFASKFQTQAKGFVLFI